MRPSTVREAAMSAWPSTWPPKTCGLPMSRLAPRKRLTSSGSRSRRRIRSAMRGSTGSRVGHAEPLVHDRARRGVLQELLLLRIEMVLDRERRERSFMEAGENQLFLSGVGIDVADGEDAGDARLETLRVHFERFALELEPPLGDRSELRMQSEKREQLIRRERVHEAIAALHMDPGEGAAFDDQRLRQPFDVAHAPGCDELAHPRDTRRGGAEFGAPVHEREARRLRSERERPVERGVSAAEDHEPFAVQRARVAHAVVNRCALERLAALEPDAPRLERTDAARNHHGSSGQRRAGARAQEKAAVFLSRELGHLLTEVQRRVERLDLLQQPVDQLLAAADRQRRNVVDGLVRIELGALAAGMRQRIDDAAADAEEPQLEDLEQAAGTRSDDDDLRRDRIGLRTLDAQARPALASVGVWKY